MAESDAGDFIPVGKISGVFGVKGWLKVFSFTDPRDNILNYKPLYMKRQGQWVKIDVTGGKLQGKAVVMGIKQVTDRNMALPLMGAEIAIERAQLKATAEDEYYWADLIGLNVVNQQGIDLGRVDNLLETGANDVLVVKAADNETELLIPLVFDEVVMQVDLQNHKIVVDWQADYL